MVGTPCMLLYPESEAGSEGGQYPESLGGGSDTVWAWYVISRRETVDEFVPPLRGFVKWVVLRSVMFALVLYPSMTILLKTHQSVAANVSIRSTRLTHLVLHSASCHLTACAVADLELRPEAQHRSPSHHCCQRTLNHRL